jgi:hypothetical protein
MCTQPCAGAPCLLARSTPRFSCVLRYLEQQAFVEQLQGLFSAVFACIDSTDTDKAAEKALRRQGFRCASQVYIAACDHLQVTRPTIKRCILHRRALMSLYGCAGSKKRTATSTASLAAAIKVKGYKSSGIRLYISSAGHHR